MKRRLLSNNQRPYRTLANAVGIFAVIVVFLAIAVTALLFIPVLRHNPVIGIMVGLGVIPIFVLAARYLWRRRTYLIPARATVNEDEIDRTIASLFTNQEFALSVFDELVTTPISSQRLLALCGMGGTGKSWLLRLYRQRARTKGMLASLVDGTIIKSVVEILTTIQHDFEDAGFEMPHFSHKLDQYKHIQAKVDRESQAWSFAKLALHVGKQIPYLRAPSQVLDLVSQEEFLTFLRGLLNREDVELYLNPEGRLTEEILRDIQKVTLLHPAVLLFDTYEKMEPYDGWISSFVLELVRANVFCVFAGRRVLAGENWDRVRAIMREAEIVPFNDSDTKRCLDKYAQGYLGMTLPPSEREKMAEFSGGLPLAIAWSVHLMSRYRVSEFSLVQSEALSNLVDTMIKTVRPELGKLFEACAVLRWFDEDVLTAMLKDEVADVDYAALRALPFIRARPEGGLVLHDRVRDLFLQELAQRSPVRQLELHKRAASFYEQTMDARQGKSPKVLIQRRKRFLELLYHTFCVDTEAGFTLLAQEINNALACSQIEYCEVLLAESAQQDLTIFHQQWQTYWRAEVAYRRGRWFDALSLLEALYSRVPGDQPVLIPLGITMGRIYYQQGQILQAKEMYQHSLSAMQGTRDVSMKGYVTEQLAKALRMEGNLDAALEVHQQALEYAQESGDHYQICSGPGSYGTTLILKGKLREGVEKLTQSIDLSRTWGYSQFVCTGLRSRAIGKMLLGRLHEAEADSAESLRVAVQMDDLFNRGFARSVFGQILSERGDSPDRAYAMLRDAIRDLASVGAKYDLGNAWIALGVYHKMQGDLEHALLSFQKAHTLLSDLGFKYGMGWLSYHWGDVMLITGQFKQAGEQFSQARSLAEAVGSLYLLTNCSLGLARTALSQNDLSGGFALLEPVLATSREMGYYDQLALAEFFMGISQLSTGFVEGAFECYWRSLSASIRHNCFLFDRIAYDVKRVCLLSSDQTTMGAIVTSFRHLVHRWETEQENDCTMAQLEIQNRQQEMGQRSSQLETILLSGER